MAEESDRVLISRARGGDARALEALVRRYLRPAFAVALAFLRSPTDAEDLAQEALMVSLQRLDQCRNPERFASWLLQSVRHRAINQLNQRKVQARLIEGPQDGATVEPVAAQLDLRRRLLAALEQLTLVQREVVLLHDLEGWTHREIATALDLSEVTSRQTLFVARHLLRATLANDSQEEARHDS
jgi:RNA polymerase sigma-70 factor (ECF subfamily)